MLEDLRYPIGRFSMAEAVTDDLRQEWIEAIEQAPELLRQAVAGLTDEQLDTPYRPDGWTVRQVIHHVADSHLNSYIRFKWILTEDNPTIKTYDEKRWAELEEARTGPLDLSLPLLETLHSRWVVMLRHLKADEYGRAFIHPEWGAKTIDFNLALYAWHGQHHAAHITSLRKRKGW